MYKLGRSRLWVEDSGQAIGEYATILALTLVLALGAIQVISSRNNYAFSTVTSAIGNTAGSSGGASGGGSGGDSGGDGHEHDGGH